MSFVKKLKDNGYRISKAREIICDILESSGHSHYSVDEIHTKTQNIDKTIDLTTVYRTLELLEELNLIEHAHQEHGSGIYYKKEKNNSIHMTCYSCNKIFDVSNKTVEKINNELKRDLNFKEVRNHFIYSGLCNNC